MREDIKQDLMSLWHSTLSKLDSGDYLGLRELSNHTVHNASIFTDEFSTTAAVIVYSLSKVGQRRLIDNRQIRATITGMLGELVMGHDEGYQRLQKQLLEQISQADRGFREHVDEVLTQARIKKGWKLYDHGISLGVSSELLGISEWELMNYVGNTTTPDQLKTDVRSRLAFARQLFRQE